MSDIAITFSNGSGLPVGFDWSLTGADLTVDQGLETAVIISWFTDRRAEDDDVLPDDATGPFGLTIQGSGDRRGWWGDWYPDGVSVADGTSPPTPTDRIGSRLWLLRREKQVQDVLDRAKEYGEESLAWMVEDAVVASVTVTASIGPNGALVLGADLQKPDGSVLPIRYAIVWQAIS
jgi:phage gp46-like protein